MESDSVSEVGTPVRQAVPRAERIERYASLRRAQVPHHRALEAAGVTELELRDCYRRDLPLCLEMTSMWGTRRRQTNADLIFLIAAKTLGRRQRAHLADLVQHWRRP